VTQWPKPELLTYSALDVFEFRYKKLDRIPACRANHMMVRPAVQAELVARYSIMKINLIGKTALCQEFESTINSRIADAGVPLPHKPMQLLGAEMVACGEKHVENTVPFRALLEAFFMQMGSQDAVCFSG
jgi:hypothetical protein